MTWVSPCRRILGLAAAAAALVLGAGASPAAAAPCDAPIANPIACEIQAGQPRDRVGPRGGGARTSRDLPQTSARTRSDGLFKVDTNATSFRLDIYRMGYYAGLGARKVATVLTCDPAPESAELSQTAPRLG